MTKPGSPQSFTADPNGPAQITLTWTVPTVGTVAEYLLYRATSNTQPSEPLMQITAPATRHEDTRSNGGNAILLLAGSVKCEW